MPGMSLLLPVHHHTIPLTNFFRSILKPPNFVSSLNGKQMAPLCMDLELFLWRETPRGLCSTVGVYTSLPASLQVGFPFHCSSSHVWQPWGAEGASPITLSSETRRMLNSKQGRAGRRRRPRAAAWGKTG